MRLSVSSIVRRMAAERGKERRLRTVRFFENRIKNSKFLEKAPSATGRNVLEWKDGTLVFPLVHSTAPRCYGDFGQRQNLGQNTDM